MKKMRFVALLAMMLAMVTLLSSCWSDSVSVKKWIDNKATYENTPILSVMTEASGIPDDATRQSSQGRLVYFTAHSSSTPSYTVHIVYDMVGNREIVRKTNTEKISYEVTLSTVSVDGESVPYCYVVEQKEGKRSITLYDAEKEIATQSNCAAPTTYCDLVYFDGTYYRMNGSGTLSKAISWSPLARRPDISYQCGEYYYEMEEELGIVVYDASLQPVSSYTLPTNAFSAGDDMLGAYILENGNVLVQYIVPLPDTAKKYSFTILVEETIMKVELHTVLFKAKSGRSKEINCDYWFVESVYRTAGDEDYNGIKPANIAWVVELEKGTVLNMNTFDEEAVCKLASVSNKGKVTLIKQFENERVLDVWMVSQNRWIVLTASGREYLIDEKAEVLGEIANSSYNRDSFFLGDGKVYDWGLTEKYNYRAQNYTVNRVMNNAVLFDGEEGEIALYYGGQVKTVVVQDSQTQEFIFAEQNYYVLFQTDSDMYCVYNEAGALLGSSKNAILRIASTEGYVLLKTTNESGTDIYYRLSK